MDGGVAAEMCPANQVDTNSVEKRIHLDASQPLVKRSRRWSLPTDPEGDNFRHVIPSRYIKAKKGLPTRGTSSGGCSEFTNPGPICNPGITVCRLFFHGNQRNLLNSGASGSCKCMVPRGKLPEVQASLQENGTQNGR